MGMIMRGAPFITDDAGLKIIGLKNGDGSESMIAQLATDAAGNAIGLSGGTPSAGVTFGPPSTIFRLRMRCAGGAAAVSVIASKRSGGTETFSFSLADGDDISESMHASDYKSMVWGKVGAGTVTVEVI